MVLARSLKRSGLIYTFTGSKAVGSMAALVVIVAGLACTSAPSLRRQTEGGISWHTSFESAFEEARQTKRLVYLEFYAGWCGYCRKMRTGVYPTPEVRPLLEKYVLLRLDGEENNRLFQHYKASSFPTLLIFDPEMNLVRRHTGYLDSQKLRAWLADSLQGTMIVDLLKRHATKNNVEFIEKLAGIYYESGRYSMALTQYRRYTASEGYSQKRIVRRLLKCTIMTGNFKEGRKYLEMLKPALDDPALAAAVRADLYFDGGRLHFGLGDYRQARDWFTRAAEAFDRANNPDRKVECMRYLHQVRLAEPDNNQTQPD